LCSNKLGFIPTDAFKWRRFLNIDLAHNDISHISLEFFDEVQVQHLDISYNRLDNKKLDLLEAWATQTNVSLEYLLRTLDFKKNSVHLIQGYSK
jgi:hypothetical protein